MSFNSRFESPLQNTIPDFFRLKDVLPEIYYQTSSEKVLTGTLMSTRHQFNENNRLQLTVARYSLGGEFLGFKRADGGTLQLCKNTNKFLDSAFDFGAYYNHGVSRDIQVIKSNPGCKDPSLAAYFSHVLINIILT